MTEVPSVVAVKPWDPTKPVEGTSSLANIITCISFGRPDAPDFHQIRDKLALRGCHSPEAIMQWDLPCLKSLIRSLKVTKDLRVYITTIGTAIGHDFYNSERTDNTAKSEGAKRPSGGDIRASCTKVDVTEGFNASKYMPDGRCFEIGDLGRYAGGWDVDGDPMPQEDEHMLLDALILDLHANPEPSLGDYLPEGLPRRLAINCDQIYPKFAPDTKGTARGRQRVITIRAQNGRNGARYPRVVLSEEYHDYVQEKSRGGFIFVKHDSEALENNPRNELFGVLLDVYRNQTLPPLSMKLPERKATAGQQDEIKQGENVAPSNVAPSPTTPPETSPEHRIDPDDIDGVGAGGGNDEPPSHPRMPISKSNVPAQASAPSKKDALKKKREQGVGGSAAIKPGAKKKRYVCCAPPSPPHRPHPAPPFPML